MRAIIRPSRAAGEIAAPPSKSMAHRLLICAALAKGESIVNDVALSDDILATLRCIEALGAKVKRERGGVKIQGAALKEVRDGTVFDCGECGTTLRFFIPVALLTEKKIIFTGSETLLNRPLGVYEELCEKEGFLFERQKESIAVKGSLQAGQYEIAGNISSQFTSGMLLALAKTGGESVIKIIPPVESRPYIDMTLQAMNVFGVNARWSDETALSIAAGQEYEAREVCVEGDYSNAAFFEAFNLDGGDVRVTGLRENSLQGDKIYRKYFPELKNKTPTIDISNCPDLGPILMAVAAMKNGAVFTGTRRLKIKESDRAETMKTELAKFGINVDVRDNKITVRGGKLNAPVKPLSGHNDHRIVMALSVLASLTGGEIEGAEAVNKSFPEFFGKIKSLGVEVNTDGMD